MVYEIMNQYSRRALRHALKRADLVIFEDVLNFLEDDPKTFGSGYMTQDMWRYIRRYPLDDTHIARLENAALLYLQRPMSCEFAYMCRTMAWIATPNFWVKAADKIETGMPQEQLNASCLLPYSQGIDAGQKVRRENKVIMRNRAMDFTRANYHLLEAHRPEKLLDLLYQPECWQQGQIVRKNAKLGDMPIIYYMERSKPDFNTEIATLDMSAVNTDLLLPKFEEFLMDGIYGIPNVRTTWLYIIYLMQQMNNPKVIPILIKFLETRVDHKFEGVSKGMLQSCVLKVLRYYATPKAQAVIEAHRAADQAYTDHFGGKSHGWVLSYP